MARIQRLLKKPNCIVLFEDEKRIVAKRYGGYEWCLSQAIVRRNQKIKGRAIIFGAYNPHSKKIYRKYFDRITKENFKRFLDHLNKIFNEELYLILDNHASHLLGKSYKKIKFVFLPTNTPKLNLMDTQFSLIQRDVLNNSYFRKIEEVEESIDRWIKSFNSRHF
jgi:transposase